MIGNKTFIAEVKVKSPSGWQSPYSWEDTLALAIQCPHVDMLSIFIDARWGGSPELVRRARSQTGKPILAKGMGEDQAAIQEAFVLGATYALIVGSIPEENPERYLIEPYTLEELARIPAHLKAVWNSRDLRKLDQIENSKTETFRDARNVFSGWLCQASNLRTVDDIESEADAVLVGTHLREFVASLPVT